MTSLHEPETGEAQRAEPAPDAARQRGFWRRARERFSSDVSAVEDAQLKADSEEAGCREIASHADRELCTLHGTLRHVTLRPHGGVVALEAELYDGSGTVTLIWLGRRQIPGITPGRQLTVHGRLGCTANARTLFNPRYELTA